MNTITDKEKLPEDDAEVVLEGDNWIGANSTILKGVTIGRELSLPLALLFLKMCRHIR